MNLLTYPQAIEKVREIKSDANDNFTDQIDYILEKGYDKNFPIIVDQYGEILDGNHRFEAFKSHNRLDELSFVICDWEYFSDYANNDEKFQKDDDYFYEIIGKIAK